VRAVLEGGDLAGDRKGERERVVRPTGGRVVVVAIGLVEDEEEMEMARLRESGLLEVDAVESSRSAERSSRPFPFQPGMFSVRTVTSHSVSALMREGEVDRRFVERASRKVAGSGPPPLVESR
jgi:hypothetical protein